MPTIKINTSNLENDGRKILDCAKDYNDLINNMFDNFIKGVAVSWSGQASTTYINAVSKDREFFLKLGTYLQKYGEELVNISEDFEKKIRKWDS
jgi:uncharacterized protein YukE